MRLSFSPRAELDIEEIGDYIARDNCRRAESFLNELEAHCYRIAEMPSAFPSREDLAAGLQMAVHGNYLIFFRLQDEAVRIERIIHGARRIGDLV
jgi:toxin ParE1/3/4